MLRHAVYELRMVVVAWLVDILKIKTVAHGCSEIHVIQAVECRQSIARINAVDIVHAVDVVVCIGCLDWAAAMNGVHQRVYNRVSGICIRKLRQGSAGVV